MNKTKIEIKGLFSDWTEVNPREALEYIKTLKRGMVINDIDKNKYINSRRLRGITVEELKKGGENMDIKEMKKDILEYNLYYLLDGVPYGDHRLTILNEGDKIIIIVDDNKGSASWAMDREEFLNISTTEELEKHINNILYYNYIEYEGE